MRRKIEILPYQVFKNCGKSFKNSLGSQQMLITPALPMSLGESICAEIVFANGVGPQSYYVSSKYL